MAEVFISYKSERRKAAAHLAKILERYGYTVWFDYHLVKGEDFADEIDSRIREAKAVVVLWCKLAVQSRWVKREAALASSLGRFIPAKIEPCDLRVDFQAEDTIDLRDWNGAPLDHKLYPLIDAVAHRVGRVPQLDFKSMRDYEEDWRRFGAPSLKTFALETPAEERHEPRLSSATVAPPPYGPTLAERDWEREQIAAIEDVEIIAAYIEQYAKSEPLWAAKARQRLKTVEALRAEKERLAQAARFTSEGRIEIAAPFVTNPKGRWFLPGAGKTEWFKDRENGPEMVVVPPGRFMMGSPKDEPQRESWKAGTESPQHEVTIPKPFAIGRCAVTRGQFGAFVTATGHKMEGGARVWTGKEWKDDPSKSWRDPGFAQDDSHPVVCVNWEDAKAYAAWLSQASGASYRLPSEAEWEYACRAGSVTPFWWGSSIAPDQANYDGNYAYEGGGKKGEYRKRTVSARSFEASPWGLYQVHGNIWEWCEDLWHDSYADKPESLKTTGGAWTTGGGGLRVLRGGSWTSDSSVPPRGLPQQRLPGRRSYNIGFRVARTLNR